MKWIVSASTLAAFRISAAERFQIFPRPTHLLWFHLTPLSALKTPAQRTDTPAEDYDNAEEVPVPEAPPACWMSEGEVPSKENEMRASQTGE